MKKEDFILIKNDKILINWDKVLKLKYFNELYDIHQNKKWHFEDNVLIHTMYVTNLSLELFGNDNNKKNKIMLISALFHDIGKVICTEYKNNNYIAPQHEIFSDRILREFLSDDEDIEIISFFVRNHMKPLYALESKYLINEILNECDNNLCTIDNLIKFKHCDCVGSIMQEEDGWREKLIMFKQISEEIQHENNIK